MRAWPPRLVIVLARTPEQLQNIEIRRPIYIDQALKIAPEQLENWNQRDWLSIAVVRVINIANWKWISLGPEHRTA
jgi:hypothetical protein